MDQYESDYQVVNQQLDTANLSNLFCQLEQQLEQIHSNEIQAEVRALFVDVNAEIEKYREQFQRLVRELGVVCKQESNDLVLKFFQALLDLFRLVPSVYQDNPEKLAPFGHLLHEFRLAVETGRWVGNDTPLQKALLLQLVTSAWVLTRTEKDMHMVAKARKQTAGKRRFTRKHKKSQAFSSSTSTPANL